MSPKRKRLPEGEPAPEATPSSLTGSANQGVSAKSETDWQKLAERSRSLAEQSS